MTKQTIVEVFKTFLISLVGAMFVFFIWTNDLLDEEEDPFTVTVDYNCLLVAKDSTDVPVHVLEECYRIFKELEKTGPEATKTGKTT